MDEQTLNSTVESRLNSLTTVVEQMAELTIASSETVEQLSQQMEAMGTHVQQQQQSHAILVEAVQALTSRHDEVLGRLDQLIEALNGLVIAEVDE
ncbi:MAG: hypothetical protein WBA57_05805 [Elainellaceae cyanobacterium]